ncbi:hypothetical protein FJT64_009527 [Amphibalanus amphitrite]|uniref:Uncharacterized protein n=1 Tax=Amphibalanus amphitrite TaxID=1232801 RepID=A0A6A4VT24_AMPAM|nr:hypothetical protein FJT64_009527 [Amphibalanus amphitrite]
MSPPSDEGDRDLEPREVGRRQRQSVSELASRFADTEPQGKRDRSESGDPAPAGKRGAIDRDGDLGSSPVHFNRRWKEYLDNALDELQQRIVSSISRDIHEFNESIHSKLSAMDERIRDLERHVEERDDEIVSLTAELRQTKEEVKKLSERAESAEMNSRIPCLILSGRALAPRQARLGAPLQSAGESAPQGGSAGAGPSDRPPTASGPGAAAPERARGGRDTAEVEDICGLVIRAVKDRLPGLDIREEDIDRAHRLPGPNHRVIVRFVQSGQNSVRDQLMTRRLELRHHNDLFINESLTAQKNTIYRSLLDAKRAKKLYTVFTRWGHVYFKAEKFGTSTRVEDTGKLRELGFAIKE